MERYLELAARRTAAPITAVARAEVSEKLAEIARGLHALAEQVAAVAGLLSRIV